jgi:hypothetical protein
VDAVNSESCPKVGFTIIGVKCSSSAASVTVGQAYQALLPQFVEDKSVVPSNYVVELVKGATVVISGN